MDCNEEFSKLTSMSQKMPHTEAPPSSRTPNMLDEIDSTHSEKTIA
jgi:hypothetical protein